MPLSTQEITMQEDFLLDDFNFDPNVLFSKDYGYFDNLALNASYAFSCEDYLKNKKRLHNQPLTEPLKTVLHETTHLYQMLATPYGIYYHTLKLLQTDLIRNLSRVLLHKCGIQPKPPLIESCKRFIKANGYSEIKQLLHGWFIAELMILYLEGDVVSCGNLLLKNPLLGALPMADYFERLEYFVTIFFNSNGKPCPGFEPSIKGANTNLLSEFQYFGLKSMGFPDTVGVLESWGKVAEFWGEQHLSLDDCPKLFPSVIKSELVDYYGLLFWARDAIDAETVGEFILSYMALCEIALSPPVLPYYRSLRTEGISLRAINPIQRMLDLFSATKGVTPIRELENDYVRFTETICSKLKWPTPVEIAKETLRTLDCPSGDRLFEFYKRAQEFRINVPHIFIDLDVWFDLERPYINEFYYYFSHPVIEFSDSIGHHPDARVPIFFTEQFLINSWVRKFFLTRDQSVIFPYRASQIELDYFTDLLKSDLNSLLGFFPDELNLVSPS
jgi:hypothetical protein